tara:strand:- start:955 stop:2310 length:1356 start_codon:yes stop_codon:yes gene_type:complete
MKSKIPEQAKEDLKAKRLAGCSWVELSDYLKTHYDISIDRTNIARWYTEEVGLLNINPDSIELDRLKDRVTLDKRLALYQAKLRQTTNLYNELVKKGNNTETLVDAIHNATIPLPKVAKIKYNKPTGKRKTESPQIMVAPLSDTHIGEQVDYNAMTGLNRYDMEIFNNRLFGWASSILESAENRRNSVPVDELIIPCLGDIISGAIHEELVLTNETHVVHQMIRGAHLISQALLYLAPHFKKIHVPCVVGNHGRMTRKPPMKDKGVMDWDHLLYQWVAAYCMNQKNITFSIPTSYFNTFNIYERNILIMHGDSASGSGAVTSITRAVSNLRSVLHYRHTLEPEVATAAGNIISHNILPKNFDSAFIGHFHRVDEWDIGNGSVYVCGTMKGGDEYAFFRLGVISKPSHIITYWSEDYGMVSKDVIYFNRFDDKPSKFTDGLPQIWAKSSAVL